MAGKQGLEEAAKACRGKLDEFEATMEAMAEAPMQVAIKPDSLGSLHNEAQRSGNQAIKHSKEFQEMAKKAAKLRAQLEDLVAKQADAWANAKEQEERSKIKAQEARSLEVRQEVHIVMPFPTTMLY